MYRLTGQFEIYNLELFIVGFVIHLLIFTHRLYIQLKIKELYILL